MLAREAAISQPEQFVLKPQREGGGFNLYDEDIRQCLNNISAEESNAYILMERLYPPISPGWGLRNGEIWQGQVVHEIGQYGVLVAHGDRILTATVFGRRRMGRAGGQPEGANVRCPVTRDAPLID